jgi:hypothetical protein
MPLVLTSFGFHHAPPPLDIHPHHSLTTAPAPLPHCTVPVGYGLHVWPEVTCTKGPVAVGSSVNGSPSVDSAQGVGGSHIIQPTAHTKPTVEGAPANLSTATPTVSTKPAPMPWPPKGSCRVSPPGWVCYGLNHGPPGAPPLKLPALPGELVKCFPRSNKTEMGAACTSGEDS